GRAGRVPAARRGGLHARRDRAAAERDRGDVEVAAAPSADDAAPLPGMRMLTMHDQWTDLMSEYIDGELPAERARELEAHVAGCAACESVLAELQAVVEAAGGTSAAPPPADLWPGIRDAID